MSARKVRLVADMIRGMDVSSALDQLRFVVKAAKRPIEKVVLSALANAEHNFRLEKEKLHIAKITVDQATRLKRWRPRAFGRAAPIKKHVCHITVVLSEKDDTKKQDKASQKRVAGKFAKKGTKEIAES